MISATDIIRQDLARGGFTAQEKRFLEGLANLIKSNRAELLRFSNTVFLIIKHAAGVAEVHIYTIDPPQTMATILPQFIKQVVQMPFRKITSKTDNPKLIGFLRHMGIPVVVDGQDAKGISFHVMMGGA